MQPNLVKQIDSVENKMESIYNQATRKVKKLPLSPASRSEGRAIIQHADQEAHEIIYNAVRQGAEMGNYEAIKAGLEEMKKKWKI